MESIGKRIQEVRDLWGITQEEFGRRIGASRGAVGNWELGGGIKRSYLQAIAQEFAIPIDWLMNGGGVYEMDRGLPSKKDRNEALYREYPPIQEDPKSDRHPAGHYRPPPQFLGEQDLPVFAAVEGGPGVMVVSTDPIEYASRPLALKHVPDSYAVLVVGDSMEPAYEPGDMVIVHPRKPAVKGKNAIFVSDEQHGEFRASVKRLVQDTKDKWLVKQFNPPKEFHLEKRDWPRALRIIGKFDGG
jgi:phage repressor protein C with HTH and peptisase S24 domain